MMSRSNQLAWCIASLQQFWHNEEGQGLLEYMLLVSTMVALVVSVMSLYTGWLGGLYLLIQTTFNALNASLAF